MSDPQYQLTPPFSNWRTGYQPPSLPVPQLTLSPQYAAGLLGWSVLARDFQVYNFMPTMPANGDDALRNALSTLSAPGQCGSSSSSPVAVPPFLQSLGVDSMDALYGLARQLGASTWGDIPSSKTNIVTGQPASAGKVSPSGAAVPTPADGVLAGFAVPLPATSAGKRFSLCSGPDVHLYVYMDKDAFSHNMRFLGSGAGVSFEGKTSGGTILKLRLGVGRDQAGGAAGFIRVQIGPDFVAMPPAP